MTDKERQELEHLRTEVEKQRVLVEAYELMLELAKGRLHFDVKKKLRGDAVSGIVERQKARSGKAMTEYLCTSLGYSKQAYYKSLRSCNDKENVSVTFFPSLKSSVAICPALVCISFGGC